VDQSLLEEVRLVGVLDGRRLLADASPNGAFAVRLPDNELKIWRNATP
jgi:hypothetical protein